MVRGDSSAFKPSRYSLLKQAKEAPQPRSWAKPIAGAILCAFRTRLRSPRKDRRGVNLISDLLPFGRLWYDTPDNAIGYAMHFSRSHDAVIRVYDNAGKVIGTHEHKGDFKAW